MKKLHVIVADDNRQFLEKLVTLLEVKCHVAGKATDGQSVLDLVRRRVPDVVVLGPNLSVLNGTEVARRLAMQSQSPPLVICSAETSPALVESALRAGAVAYVSIARISEDLVKAVRLAHQGRSFLSDDITELSIANRELFFKELGRRVRDLREKAKYSQEDMSGFGFSARHWQQIETGRPTTMTTLLRICETFHINPEDLIRGLARGTDAN
jgi:CheY-like chemotaxis protein/DNA-binding XRE family transcriptional regulator